MTKTKAQKVKKCCANCAVVGLFLGEYTCRYTHRLVREAFTDKCKRWIEKNDKSTG